MTPAEIRTELDSVNRRVVDARTAAGALLVLAAAVLIGAGATDAVSAAFAETCALLATLGALAAAGVDRFLCWRRTDLYDSILLAGYRHVEQPGVLRREAVLLSDGERRQLASTLESFLESARSFRPTAVPLNRSALRRCQAQVHELVRLLRDERLSVRAAGMVLLHRLLSDGATSPLFDVDDEHARLAQALERVIDALVPAPASARLV